MNQQLRLGDSYPSKSYESDSSVENQLIQNGEEVPTLDYDLHADVNSEASDTITLEQRRAFKIEMQVTTVLLPHL